VLVNALESEMADNTPQDDELDLTDDELVLDPSGEPEELEPEPEEPELEEPEPEEPESEESPTPRQPASRAGRTVAALRADRRRQNEELAALRREMAELRQTRQQAPVQQEDPRVEQERLALMSPEERMEYRLARSLQAHQQQTSAMVFNMQTAQDKAAWDARTAGDKLRSKLAADVEREYQACIARGQYLPRENIYIYLVGQRFIANRGKGDGTAARRVERERVRPSSGRGDVTSDRRTARGATGSTSDFERRHGDMQI
jgi:hypothetical protein